jgi:hypothetical protein
MHSFKLSMCKTLTMQLLKVPQCSRIIWAITNNNRTLIFNRTNLCPHLVRSKITLPQANRSLIKILPINPSYNLITRPTITFKIQIPHNSSITKNKTAGIVVNIVTLHREEILRTAKSKWLVIIVMVPLNGVQ